jgi:phosphatidylglycerophosphatase A
MSAAAKRSAGFPGNWFVAIATLGLIGQKLPAPGTWGSLAGLLYFRVFFTHVNTWENIGISVVAAVIAAFFCGAAEVVMGKKDPGEVILDEFVAMPLCFLFFPALVQRWPMWAVLLGGFALFRFYDILKPLGINRLQAIKGGWGVVIDDTAAALAACATLHVLVRLFVIRA